MRLLLVLSLWHAPLPWVHSHAMAGPIVDQVASLARHIDEFHPDAAQDTLEAGWHMHLVLPWSLSHHTPCPYQHNHDDGSNAALGLNAGIVMPAPLPVSVGYAANGELLLVDAAGSAEGLHRGGLTQLSNTRNSPGHFLGTFGGSVSLGDLLSVRTC